MIEMWDDIFSKQNSAINDALTKEIGNKLNEEQNTCTIYEQSTEKNV
jgi:hypothetical protein